MPITESYTCFNAQSHVASGDSHTVAMAAKKVMNCHPDHALLIFDDSSGRSTDFNLHGSMDDVAARYPSAAPSAPAEGAPRGRGRPKLGVVPREVTLLPRHWDWLAAQPGGASVTLRKLVEQARRSDNGQREVQARAYHFMSAMAGDLPQFEAASRALFAQDLVLFTSLIQDWPQDIQTHLLRLATVDEAMA